MANSNKDEESGLYIYRQRRQNERVARHGANTSRPCFHVVVASSTKTREGYNSVDSEGVRLSFDIQRYRLHTIPEVSGCPLSKASLQLLPLYTAGSRLTTQRAHRRRTDPKMPNAPMVRQLRPFWNTHGMRTRSRARKTTRFLPVLPGD